MVVIRPKVLTLELGKSQNVRCLYERDIIEFLLGVCEDLLHSRDSLLRIAVNVEDWERHYERGLSDPEAMEPTARRVEHLRTVVEMVLAGASVESLRAFRPGGPSVRH